MLDKRVATVSELNSEAELYITWTDVCRARHTPKLTIAERRIRSSELRSIRDIEHLPSELSFHRLAPSEVLQDRKVCMARRSEANVRNPPRRVTDLELPRL